MDRVIINTYRRIADHMVERLPGQLYDIYYRAIEELVQQNVDKVAEKAINNTFLHTADTNGLKRWEFFYTHKPKDMSDESWRDLVIILNELTREGPTFENVRKLLQFFDATADFSALKPLPLYAGTPQEGRVSITRGATPEDTATTIYPWEAGVYNSDSNSIISWRDAVTGITYTYTENTDYTVNFGNSGGLLEVSVTWPASVGPPATGVYSLVFIDSRGEPDLPYSAFYNRVTGTFPTEEYVILSENSSFSTNNEFIAFDSAFTAYISTVMSVALISHRQLLKDLLNMVLPANVVFILRFDAKPPIYYGVMDLSQANKGKHIAVYSADYETITQGAVVISGQENARISSLLSISDTEYLVSLVGAVSNWKTELFTYNILSGAFTPLYAIGYGGVELLRVNPGAILIVPAGAAKKECLLLNTVTRAITTISLTSIFAAHENIWKAAITPAGEAVFLTWDAEISGNRWRVRIVNLLSHTLVETYTLPTPAVPHFLCAVTNQKILVGCEGSPATFYYMDMSSGTQVNTSFTLDLRYIRNDTVVATDSQHIYFGRNNDDMSYTIYDAAWGETPAEFTSVVDISSSQGGVLFIIYGNYMILANKFKRVIFIENFAAASPVITEKYLDNLIGSGYNTIPYGILT